MRSTLFGLLVVVAACGGSSAKSNGESCFASSDCEDGLVCDMGRDSPVCAPTSTMMVDAPMADAGDDAAGPDAPMTADAAPDGPRPDGRPIDAAIDAAVDAAEPDAPVDADIDAM
jgi:hypothetical protein